MLEGEGVPEGGRVLERRSAWEERVGNMGKAVQEFVFGRRDFEVSNAASELYASHQVRHTESRNSTRDAKVQHVTVVY